jgi:hypothetical protein
MDSISSTVLCTRVYDSPEKERLKINCNFPIMHVIGVYVLQNHSMGMVTWEINEIILKSFYYPIILHIKAVTNISYQIKYWSVQG